VDEITRPNEEMLKKANDLIISEDENGINEIGESLLKIAEAVNSKNIELTPLEFDFYFSSCQRLAFLAGKGNPTAIWRILLINHGRSLEDFEDLEDGETPDLKREIEAQTVHVNDLTVNSNGELMHNKQNVSKRNDRLDEDFNEVRRASDERFSPYISVPSRAPDEASKKKAEDFAVRAFKDPNSQKIRVVFPDSRGNAKSVALEGFIRKDWLGKSGFNSVAEKSRTSKAEGAKFWEDHPLAYFGTKGGWKIHVAMTPSAALSFFFWLEWLLKGCNLDYKVSGSIRAIRGLGLMSTFGELSSQLGKIVVFYPRNDSEAVAIATMVDNIAMFAIANKSLYAGDFPVCTGDLQVGNSGAVTVRWSNDFSDHEEDPKNRLSPEIIGTPFDKGYKHPFAELGLKYLGISLPAEIEDWEKFGLYHPDRQERVLENTALDIDRASQRKQLQFENSMWATSATNPPVVETDKTLGRLQPPLRARGRPLSRQ
jgi:hypothetical protein